MHDFSSKGKRKIVTPVFPYLKLNNVQLKYAHEFKYLGYIICYDEIDNKDVLREVHTLFTRANILARRFALCSIAVKSVKSFCICFYGMELWKCFTAGALNRLRSCYIRCLETFFGYAKCHSVTAMLFELGLTSFDTLLCNSQFKINRQLLKCENDIIDQLQ